MRILTINDPHCSDTPPAGRTEEYGKQIMEKLLECWQLAADRHCDFILMTGDLFRKFRGLIVSDAMKVQLLRLYRAAPCEVLSLAGNHDLSSDGVSSVWRMPFGLLAEAGAYRWLDKPLYHQAKDGEELLIIPRNWEPYIDKMSTAFKLSKDEAEKVAALGECSYVVMAAHASILPPGDTRPYPYHDADKLLTKGLDWLTVGHIHENLGIHKLASGCWFTNVGSLARVERSKHNLTRVPSVLLTTLEKGEVGFEQIPLQSARPAAEIFYEMPEEVERGAADFAASLESALDMEELPLDELIALYTKDDPPQVVDRLKSYLEGVSA